MDDSVLSQKGAPADYDLLAQSRRQLAAAVTQRRLLSVLMLQDLADSLIALQEVVGARLSQVLRFGAVLQGHVQPRLFAVTCVPLHDRL